MCFSLRLILISRQEDIVFAEVMSVSRAETFALEPILLWCLGHRLVEVHHVSAVLWRSDKRSKVVLGLRHKHGLAFSDSVLEVLLILNLSQRWIHIKVCPLSKMSFVLQVVSEVILLMSRC